MSLVEVEIDDRQVAHLTLNRPEVRNAFNAELIGDLEEAVTSASEESRVIVLSGHGKGFSSGADLEWMRGMAGYSHEENVEDSRKLQKMLEAIDGSPVPVVARIHGAAIAGATGVVACCDYAVASVETVFAFSEVRLGLIPAIISPYVVRKVGYSFARAMFLTAERFTAERAFQVGLIHKVVPEDGLDSEVARVVDDLLAGGPEALKGSRDLLDRVHGRPPGEVRGLTVETIAEKRVSAEGQEGVTAFLEKRPPNWNT